NFVRWIGRITLFYDPRFHSARKHAFGHLFPQAVVDRFRGLFFCLFLTLTQIYFYLALNFVRWIGRITCFDNHIFCRRLLQINHLL
ncbi:hypothetical protein, partial [Halobacteriovorax sp. RT-2-1]|uniref:hypothetical protein n=1 Tax=Halobacteriovorax sp. RT-2-1 TaxID=3391164 RepID=UPI00399C117E